MANIKYPNQYERLKKIRKLSNLTAMQAAELVHTDLRNWQRWESGENRVCEAVVELFCIKNNLNYKDFSQEKAQAQIKRDIKRQNSFKEFKEKISKSTKVNKILEKSLNEINEVEKLRKKSNKLIHS